jgi:poly-gamma-glutamate capsule biosynthesis protein CapA/YwtB (metallophosphatase superfamily)
MRKKLVQLALLATIITPILYFSGGSSFFSQNWTAISSSKSPNTPPQYSKPFLDKKTDNLTADSAQTLRLMFGGDIMSQLLQIEAGEIGGGRYDFTPVFQYIKPVLETADLAIANLECTLPDAPPYTGYPNFKTPEALAKALKVNGFDVLVTANNHSLDAGLDGLKNTLKTIREAGFVHTGTFADSAHKDLLYPLIIYKNGFKIALLNYTHHTNGYRTPAPSIVNRLDVQRIKTDIAAARQMKPDVIITFLHWGEEYHLDEDANQREVARMLHTWGSDLVIGAHPHVIQPIKNEQVMLGKRRVNFLTAYSLGNFISAQPFPNTEGGILFEVNLKKERGQVLLGDYFYIPVLRYTPYERGRRRFYALPISAAEGNEDALQMPLSERIKMQLFAHKMRTHLGRFGAIERRFDNSIWAER